MSKRPICTESYPNLLRDLDRLLEVREAKLEGRLLLQVLLVLLLALPLRLLDGLLRVRDVLVELRNLRDLRAGELRKAAGSVFWGPS